MSIQPLSNTPLQTYSPPAGVNSAQETPAAKATAQQPASNPIQDETKSLDKTDMKKAVHEATQKANQAVEGLRSDLKFTVDEATGSDVVKFIDVKTKEVIRQIPAQEMLEIAKRLDELRGLLIKERA